MYVGSKKSQTIPFSIIKGLGDVEVVTRLLKRWGKTSHPAEVVVR